MFVCDVNDVNVKGIDHLQFQQVRAWKKYSNYICKITRGGRCGENKNSVVPSLGDFVAFGPAMSVRTQPGSQALIRMSSLESCNVFLARILVKAIIPIWDIP